MQKKIKKLIKPILSCWEQYCKKNQGDTLLKDFNLFNYFSQLSYISAIALFKSLNFNSLQNFQLLLWICLGPILAYPKLCLSDTVNHSINWKSLINATFISGILRKILMRLIPNGCHHTISVIQFLALSFENDRFLSFSLIDYHIIFVRWSISKMILT